MPTNQCNDRLRHLRHQEEQAELMEKQRIAISKRGFKTRQDIHDICARVDYFEEDGNNE